MRWSFKIARIAGSEVRIHYTFLLLLAWIAYSSYQSAQTPEAGTAAALSGVAFTLGLFFCVLLHEFGHALAARAFGIPTPDITLWPIGGVARLQRMPDRPWQELVVAVAGPMVNVVIAGLLIAFAGVQFHLGNFPSLDDPQAFLVVKLAWVNIALVLFNLIPAFPMDGGRVLRALLAMVMPHALATLIAGRIGQVLAVGFAIAGYFYDPMLIFIAIFIFMAAKQEIAYAQMKEAAHRLSVADIMVTQLLVLPMQATLQQAAETLTKTPQFASPVIGDNQFRGILLHADLTAALPQAQPGATVADIMRHNVPRIPSDMHVDEAVRLMQESHNPALPVLDPGTGNLIGLLTIENLNALAQGGKPVGKQPPPLRPAQQAG